jgi:hypothetical protein
MIRRHAGDEWWLFTQDDHARLSGDLAMQLGGGDEAVTPLGPEVVRAIASHDAGWPDADGLPLLNAQHQPIDVFETPLPDALAIWRRSSQRAWASHGDRAGLLVSLHSLALSAAAAGRALQPPVAGPPDFRLHFQVNKFQHAEVEQQETCRRRLGMRDDIPLTLGLAADSIEPAEQQLIYDFRWLQAMDMLSLNLCCTTAPFPTLHHVSAKPGGVELRVHVSRVGPGRALVRPWVFAVPRVTVAIPFRRLLATAFVTAEAYREALSAAPLEELALELFPTGPLAASA